MKFSEIIDQATALLQRKGRITYRSLKLEFDLDDEQLDVLKEELIDGQELATDKDDKVLVWAGSETSEEPPSSVPLTHSEQIEPAGERRQLTVMFCDLVGSTALSEQLDPEELQSVVRTYQEVSAQIIERYEGYIAQYLGDGLLVYFGYPAAHEDDAARAVRVGLEITATLQRLSSPSPFQGEGRGEGSETKSFQDSPHSFDQLRTGSSPLPKGARELRVRIGIHTGPVVVGQMGGGSRQEQLALGETPNIAARVQGHADPDTVVISAATQQLVAGLFETEDRGRHELKGISAPQGLYRVRAESSAQSRFEAAVRTGLTPLVGRDSELSTLRERWTQAQAGEGQVVSLSGEPGIGKSRLVEEIKAQVSEDGIRQIEFRCSPYHQNSALHPITEHLQRLLRFTSDDTPETKLDKLQKLLSNYRFPQADTLPLLAALLSLPLPTGVPPPSVSPQKQKEQTQAALVSWLIEEAEQAPIYNAWEDLHWADPSTLELLDLFLAQVPTSQLFVLLTFRPEFSPPWGTHSYLSHLTLSRLGQPQVTVMVERVTDGKALPEEVVEQIVTKTDGVPLFVEELTKMVVESDFVRPVNDHYELTGPLPPLAIPSTLQDSLMARLDRLTTAREVAQLGATLGREFSYELLHAVSPLNESTLQHGLTQLIETELVYQHGLPPQASYLFKHALIQDTAYASLLKSRRQQLHQHVAQVLEQQFGETIETQPELVAHHYTEAGCIEQAIPYWQKAGQRASDRFAYVEAVRQVTTGLSLLQTLPETPTRQQQELSLQIVLGTATLIVRGQAAPEVAAAFTRARVLCQQLGDTQDVSPILFGLWRFSAARADFSLAHQLGEELLSLAEKRDETPLWVIAHYAMGGASYFRGELLPACSHLEEGLTCYAPAQRSSPLFRAGQDPGVACHAYAALTRWSLGYPDQALARSQDALGLASDISHPFSTAFASLFASYVCQFRRENQAAYKYADTAITLSTEQGFPLWLAMGSILRGWAEMIQGQGEEGLRQIRQGLAAWRAAGVDLGVPYFLSLQTEAHSCLGQVEAGLAALREGSEVMERTGERQWHAEITRLKGVLLLQRQGQVQAESEGYFRQAIEIAKHQQAKSWELRAATSLARLWQEQGRRAEARDLLAPVYNWFTEGFDTKDLQEAKALLKELK